MRAFKLAMLSTLIPFSFSIMAATGITIQSATQTMGMPMGGNTNISYIVTNNLGSTITGLSYSLSSSSFANMSNDSGCSTLTSGASCFFTENMTTNQVGSGMMGAPKVCIGGAACWQPQVPTSMDVLASDHVVCWGHNDHGQSVSGATGPDACPGGSGNYCSNTASIIDTTLNGSALTGVQQVEAGANYSCALMVNGTVKCWGLNSYGDLGSGDCTNTDSCQSTVIPTTVEGTSGAGTTLTNIASISIATNSSFALTTAGTVMAWGAAGNTSYSLGNNSTSNTTAPVSVLSAISPNVSLSGVTQLSAGANGFGCALLTNGRISCWGYATDGEMGNGDLRNNAFAGQHGLVSVITGATTATSAHQVNCGNNFCCAVTGDAHVDCWGGNALGQLGGGNSVTNDCSGGNTCHYTPVEVLGGAQGGTYLSNVQSIMAGYSHVCAMISDGTLYCWGSNTHGELGNGSTSAYVAIPVQVSGLSAVATQGIATGNGFSCALQTNGTEKCWGDNDYAALGNPSASTTQTTPVIVEAQPTSSPSTLTGILGVSHGQSYQHTCALIAN